RCVMGLESEIDRCVTRALAGEASLETLIAILLTGRPPDPEHDEAWTREQTRVWRMAVDRWTARRQRKAKRKPQHERSATTEPPTVAEVWGVVLQEPSSECWVVPHLTWPRLAGLLRMGSRSAQWYLSQMGWVFEGKGQG